MLAILLLEIVVVPMESNLLTSVQIRLFYHFYDSFINSF
jgi:hypothetical protein